MVETAYLEKFAQSGYYLRLDRAQYEKYVGALPAEYRNLKHSYIFLDAEEQIPHHTFTWSPLAAGADSGTVDLTEKVPIKVEVEGLIYQYFRGCKTLCRQYTLSPAGEKAMAPDTKSWDPATAPDIGYLDERNSPFENPSPISQIWLVKGVKLRVYPKTQPQYRLLHRPTSLERSLSTASLWTETSWTSLRNALYHQSQ